MRIVKPHAPFIIILILFTVGVLIHQATLPPFEGGDEGLHLNYMFWLLNEGELPDRATSLTNSVRQAGGQPPLFYAASALVVRLLNLPVTNGDPFYAALEATQNRWYTPPDQWNASDNRNVYLPDNAESSPELTAAVAIDRAVRFVALAFGIVGIIGMYGAAREVFQRPLWVFTATAIFAFTPQYMHMSAIFHNDISAYALSALVIWLTLRLLRVGASPLRLIIIGVLLGLAGLAKINALLIAPAVLLAVLLEARAARRSFLRLIINGLLVALPLIVILAPWLFYGWLNYGDPLGTATHLRPGYYYPVPLSLIEILPLVSEVYLGYWGKLASAVYLHPLVYTALGSLFMLAALGYWFGRRSRWWAGNLRQQQMSILFTVTIFTLIGVIHWLQTIHFITGRLAYPAHVPFALAVAGGLALLANRFTVPRLIAVYALGILITSALVAAPISLALAYRPLDRHMTVPSDLLNTPITFAAAPNLPPAIQFLGYTRESDSLHSGDLIRYTLCWEVLQGSPPRNAAFSLKVFGQDGAQIADRTSLIGMGRYPSSLWRTGDTICDQVDLPVTGMTSAGAIYNVILVLLDADTFAVDWTARDGSGEIISVPVIASMMG